MTHVRHYAQRLYFRVWPPAKNKSMLIDFFLDKKFCIFKMRSCSSAPPANRRHPCARLNVSEPTLAAEQGTFLLSVAHKAYEQ